MCLFQRTIMWFFSTSVIFKLILIFFLLKVAGCCHYPSWKRPYPPGERSRTEANAGDACQDASANVATTTIEFSRAPRESGLCKASHGKPSHLQWSLAVVCVRLVYRVEPTSPADRNHAINFHYFSSFEVKEGIGSIGSWHKVKVF